MADILERLRGNGSWEPTTIDGKKKVWLGLHEGDIREAADEIERMRQENDRLREGLTAAIRAAKLALFVINKQGVMPNSSWESGFNSDVAAAVAARGILSVDQ